MTSSDGVVHCTGQRDASMPPVMDPVLQVDVALDCPGQDSFTYAVEPEHAEVAVGECVQVPFARRRMWGFVIARRLAPPPEFTLRPILARRAGVRLPAGMLELAKWAAGYYRCSLGSFLGGVTPAAVRKGVATVVRRFCRPTGTVPDQLTARQREVLEQLPDEWLAIAEVRRRIGCTEGVLKRLVASGAVAWKEEDDLLEEVVEAADERHALTDEQQHAVDAVMPLVDDPRHDTFLLYGVTGSGKTLVYMSLIERVISSGRQALVLLPEIALTPQLAARFRRRFQRVVVWHSGFTDGERGRQWRSVQEGEVDLVVGTRSALFAPLERLGLIVVDEEHDSSYKQDATPRYHGRDLAIAYGHRTGVPVVLGSATPSTETIASVRAGRFQVLTLRQRPAGSQLPQAVVVDMREEFRRQKRQAVVSDELIRRLQGVKDRGEQAVVLLNRRGWASFVACPSCSFVFTCDDCDISLTYHRGDRRLRCHYCGHERGVPAACPTCGEQVLRAGGVGTEQLASVLQQHVTGLRVTRMDADTVQQRQGHARILRDFIAGESDCLVGTQMVAKGLDCPRVTLVGVVNADQGLHMPDFRAAERTFQLIAQVSGRAGRGTKPGCVVVQTYDPDVPAITCALQNRPRRFYDHELSLRERYGYPPYAGLLRILWRGVDEQAVIAAAEAGATVLRDCCESEELLGPGPSGMAFVQGNHRWHLLVKAGSRGAIQRYLARVRKAGGLPGRRGVHVAFDVDPYVIS